MAPPNMKFTWQDIINGIFPSAEQIKKREKLQRSLHNLMGEFINEHQSQIPPEVLAKSDYIRDYHKYK